MSFGVLTINGRDVLVTALKDVFMEGEFCDAKTRSVVSSVNQQFFKPSQVRLLSVNVFAKARKKA
jgi:hypothetical protein